MAEKKLDKSSSLQRLDLTDAKAIYRKEFHQKPYEEFLRKFESVAYASKSYGYNNGTLGIAITGPLVADTHVMAALLAEVVPEKGQDTKARYSLAVFLKMAEISNDGAADGRKLFISNIFDDMDRLWDGKGVMLAEPYLHEHEFSGNAVGATIRCFDKITVEQMQRPVGVEVVVHDMLLDSYAMELRTYMHNRMLLLRTQSA